ncbi:MAG: aldo/keto reductase [Gemmatimonadetes bacterium]|nr:aldo/keto reductase [Gemmatimonadota bacterium]
MSPWDRSVEETGILAYCLEHGITLFAHSPAGGAERVAQLKASERLSELGRALSLTPVELVIAWLLTLSPAVAAIPGASRPASIESSLRAAAHRLDPATARELEAAFEVLSAES